MTYRFLWLALNVMVSFVGAQENQRDRLKILLKVFESPEFTLTNDQLDGIRTLLHSIEDASPHMLVAAARITGDAIAQQVADLQKTVTRNKEQGQPTPFSAWRTLHLLLEQKKHFEDFIQNHPQSLTRKVTSWVKGALTWMQLYDDKEEQQAEHLASQIIDFITLERENILFSYPATLAYLSAQQIDHQTLPDLISFWNNPEHRHRLLFDVKQMAPAGQVQSFIIDLLIQTAIMMGESLYEQELSQKDKAYYDQLAIQQKTMQEGFSAFEKNLASQQDASIKNITGQFSQNVGALNQQRTRSDTLFTQQVTYLNDLFDDSPPKENYVIYQIDFDQAFEVSPMYTPAGYTWYNIYPSPSQVLATAAANGVAVGFTTDWQYDSVSNQFYQYNLIPFQASKAVQDAAGKTLTTGYLPDTGQYAHNNSIFCEYIANASSYEIDVDLTCIGVSYPFFAGIMFNKARWISGVVERIEQYRLVGIYGTADDQGAKKIIIGFADYKYIPATDENSKPTIVAPLSQITAPTYTPLIQLDPKIADTIGKNPVTFNIHILTQRTVVTISVSVTDSQGNKQSLVQDTSLSDLDPLRYLYHGIGFMAPGCQAAFKINKPDAFTYTPEQRTAFDQMIASELQKRLKSQG